MTSLSWSGSSRNCGMVGWVAVMPSARRRRRVSSGNCWMQRAERRGDLQRTVAHRVDRMALRAVQAHEGQAALRGRRLLREGRCGRSCRHCGQQDRGPRHPLDGHTGHGSAPSQRQFQHCNPPRRFSGHDPRHTSALQPVALRSGRADPHRALGWRGVPSIAPCRATCRRVRAGRSSARRDDARHHRRRFSSSVSIVVSR